MGKSVSTALHNLTLPGPGGESRKGCEQLLQIYPYSTTRALLLFRGPYIHDAFSEKRKYGGTIMNFLGDI